MKVSTTATKHYKKSKSSITRMEQISAKLDILDEIERKMNKLESIEEKIEEFSLRLDNIEKSVSSLRCEVNSVANEF